MSDASDNPKTTLTTTPNHRVVRDNHGNTASVPRPWLQWLRQLAYQEKPHAEITDSNNGRACNVEMEQFEKLIPREFSFFEALNKDGIRRDSSIGPLTNLCKKEPGQSR